MGNITSSEADILFSERVKKLPALQDLSFVIVFTRAPHCILSWVSWILCTRLQIFPSRSSLIPTSIYAYVSEVIFSFQDSLTRFPSSILSYVGYTPSPSHAQLFDHFNWYKYILWRTWFAILELYNKIIFSHDSAITQILRFKPGEVATQWNTSALYVTANISHFAVFHRLTVNYRHLQCGLSSSTLLSGKQWTVALFSPSAANISSFVLRNLHIPTSSDEAALSSSF
jgi:hypothetical protein